MPRNKSFHRLIAFLLEGLGRSTRATTTLACYGLTDDGNVTKEMVDFAIETDQDFRPEDAISCGVTANAFCFLFAKAKKLAVECTLAELVQRVKDAAPRVIRLDSANHSYVLEQIDTRGTPAKPLANVYQSNVGVIGDPLPRNAIIQEKGITHLQYLREMKNPVDLGAYLEKVGKIVEKKGTLQERFDLYKEAYIVGSFTGKDKVSLTAFQKAEAAGKFAFRFSHQIFAEQSVLDGAVHLLKTADLQLLVAEAQKIYRELPIGPG